MKEAYYFSHDSNASQDEKILNLRADHGWEGYGIYWAIIERLRDTDGYKYKIASIKGLAASLGLKPNNIHDVIYNYDLFENDGEFFWSKSLINRMQLVEDLRERNRIKGIKSGEIRTSKINNGSTTVEPELNNGSTTVDFGLNQTSTETNKRKEKKRNEILDTHTIAREAKIEILEIFEKSGLDLTGGGGEREFEKFMAYYDQRGWKTSDGVSIRDPIALARTWTPKPIHKPTNQQINGNSNSGKHKIGLTEALKEWGQHARTGN